MVLFAHGVLSFIKAVYLVWYYVLSLKIKIEGDLK